MYHGGHNDVITGNIVDLESAGNQEIAAYQPKYEQYADVQRLLEQQYHYIGWRRRHLLY